MEIQRNYYLQRLLNRRHNGMIKVITGIRRCGKSYLLFELFVNALKAEGVDNAHIIKVNLEDRHNKELRNPDALLRYIDGHLKDEKMHYILLDEVQLVKEFEDVLNSYLHIPNADVYVTGSNAKFLSKDIITEFRGRGDEIRIHPLSFKEFLSAKKGDPKDTLLREYMLYGGLPQIAIMENNSDKEEYLLNLFTHTYLRDIKERNHILLDAEMEELIDILASSIGGPTNPRKLMNTFHSVKQSRITQDTIRNYLEYLQDAFMVERSLKFDIKGKRYIETPSKYYFEDLGLRNARIHFRQIEETHLMENLIYNELRQRGYLVDVGQIDAFIKKDNNKKVHRQLEVDFVCNMGYNRIYIQSAFSMPTDEKKEQELRSLKLIGDEFQKVVIVGGFQPTYKNNDGILFLNLLDFLTIDNPF